MSSISFFNIAPKKRDKEALERGLEANLARISSGELLADKSQSE